MHQSVQERQPTRADFLLLNLTTVMLAGPSLFAKLINLPPQIMVFGRAILAAVALYIFFQFTRQPIQLLNKKDRNMLFILGVVMAAHWVTVVHSIQVSTVAVGMIAVHTHPILTILIEPWVFNEKFRWTDLLLGVAVLIGVIILVPELTWSNSTALGVFWGVFSAALFATRNVLSRGYVRRYPGSVVMFYQMIVVAVVLSPFLFVTQFEWVELFSWRLFALGIIFTAGAHSLYVSAMKRLKAKTVGVVSVAQVPYAILLAIPLLGEVPDWRAILGGAIILGVVIIENLSADE